MKAFILREKFTQSIIGVFVAKNNSIFAENINNDEKYEIVPIEATIVSNSSDLYSFMEESIDEWEEFDPRYRDG